LPEVTCGCKKRDVRDVDNWAGDPEQEVFETKASKEKHMSKAEAQKRADAAINAGLDDLAKRVTEWEKSTKKEALDNLATLTQEFGGYTELEKAETVAPLNTEKSIEQAIGQLSALADHLNGGKSGGVSITPLDSGKFALEIWAGLRVSYVGDSLHD